MSTSGLKLPTSTELEGRVREALKAAREAKRLSLQHGRREPPNYIGATFDSYEALCKIVGILEDGRS